MFDLFSLVLDFIKNILGVPPSGQAIPQFAPFYNLVIVLWMAAIAAIFVAPFWKRFRGFAALLTWFAIFTTLIMKGSSSQLGETDVLSALFNISFSTVILIIFVILTLLIFSKLMGREKVMPISR